MTLTDRDRKIVLFVLPVAARWWPTGSCCSRRSARRPASSATELAQAEMRPRRRRGQVAERDSSAKSDFAADFAEVLRVGKAIPSTVDMPASWSSSTGPPPAPSIGFKSIKAGQRTAAQPLPPAAPADAGSSPPTPAARPAASRAGPGGRDRRRGRRDRRCRERGRRRRPRQHRHRAPAPGATGTAPASTPCRSTSPSRATSSSWPTSSTGSSASCT